MRVVIIQVLKFPDSPQADFMKCKSNEIHDVQFGLSISKLDNSYFRLKTKSFYS